LFHLIVHLVSANKADEAASKKREKDKELLNAEQAELGGKVKKAPAAKGGKKKKDDLSLCKLRSSRVRIKS
jgi:hypothetical protein